MAEDEWLDVAQPRLSSTTAAPRASGKAGSQSETRRWTEHDGRPVIKTACVLKPRNQGAPFVGLSPAPPDGVTGPDVVGGTASSNRLRRNPSILKYMMSHPRSVAAQYRDPSILDHGINVADVPVPHRLSERGW